MTMITSVLGWFSCCRERRREPPAQKIQQDLTTQEHRQSCTQPLMVNREITIIEQGFGAREWKHFFDVHVEQKPLPPEFLAFWDGPDPLDGAKKVSDTHLPPILCPQFLTDITGKVTPYSLERLNALMQHPENGYPAAGHKVSCDFWRDIKKGHQMKQAGPGCWLVMRKDVLARGRFPDEQLKAVEYLNEKLGALTPTLRYQKLPSFLDLATVVFLRFLVTGERHLGGTQGMERRVTYSRCQNIRYDKKPVFLLQIGNLAFSKSRGEFVLDIRIDTEARNIAYGIAPVMRI